MPTEAVRAPETLSAKVDLIKAKLEELGGGPVASIREANTTMGLTPDGLTLPEQADRLLELIG